MSGSTFGSGGYSTPTIHRSIDGLLTIDWAGQPRTPVLITPELLEQIVEQLNVARVHLTTGTSD
jgi:hypothetical protein